jgi:hypothetical protein
VGYGLRAFAVVYFDFLGVRSISFGVFAGIYHMETIKATTNTTAPNTTGGYLIPGDTIRHFDCVNSQANGYAELSNGFGTITVLLNGVQYNSDYELSHDGGTLYVNNVSNGYVTCNFISVTRETPEAVTMQYGIAIVVFILSVVAWAIPYYYATVYFKKLFNNRI